MLKSEKTIKYFLKKTPKNPIQVTKDDPLFELTVDPLRLLRLFQSVLKNDCEEVALPKTVDDIILDLYNDTIHFTKFK